MPKKSKPIVHEVGSVVQVHWNDAPDEVVLITHIHQFTDKREPEYSGLTVNDADGKLYPSGMGTWFDNDQVVKVLSEPSALAAVLKFAALAVPGRCTESNKRGQCELTAGHAGLHYSTGAF